MKTILTVTALLALSMTAGCMADNRLPAQVPQNASGQITYTPTVVATTDNSFGDIRCTPDTLPGPGGIVTIGCGN